MSRDYLSSFKSPGDFSIGNMSEAISKAFGNLDLPPKPSSTEGGTKKKLGSLKTKPIGKDTFLTAAEMNEIEEQMVHETRTAMTYEEMIREVDDIKSGMRTRDDDLVEIRRRLERCQAGLDLQEAQYQGLDRSAKEIHSQSKVMMKKFRSVATLPKYS